jgi:uncharacterized alpha-E superfamily protein
MTYRARYHASPQLSAVLDLLLCDDTNPRSAIYQIATLDDHIAHLPSGEEEGLLTADQRLVTRLKNELKLADAVELGAGVVRFDTRLDLDRLLRRIDRDVHELSDHIAQRFFSHSSPTHVGGAGGGRA